MSKHGDSIVNYLLSVGQIEELSAVINIYYYYIFMDTNTNLKQNLFPIKHYYFTICSVYLYISAVPS